MTYRATGMLTSVLALACTSAFAAEPAKPLQMAQSDKLTVTNPATTTAQKKATGAATESMKSGVQQRTTTSVPNRSQDTAHKMGPRTGAQMAPHEQSGNAGQGPGQTGYRKGPTQMAPHDQSGNAGQGPGQTGYGRQAGGSTVGQPNPNTRTIKGAQMNSGQGGAEGQGPAQNPGQNGYGRQTGGSTVGQPNPAASKAMNTRGAQMAPHDQSGNAGQGPGQTGYERSAGGIAGQPNPAANAVKGMR